jgi:hypothetical protein
MTTGNHPRRGLNPDATIAREGALARVPGAFQPVVAAARAQLATAFGGRRMHSAYLYGSIPRGTAIPGTSDLDLLVARAYARRRAARPGPGGRPWPAGGDDQRPGGMARGRVHQGPRD